MDVPADSPKEDAKSSAAKFVVWSHICQYVKIQAFQAHWNADGNCTWDMKSQSDLYCSSFNWCAYQKILTSSKFTQNLVL